MDIEHGVDNLVGDGLVEMEIQDEIFAQSKKTPFCFICEGSSKSYYRAHVPIL